MGGAPMVELKTDWLICAGDLTYTDIASRFSRITSRSSTEGTMACMCVSQHPYYYYNGCHAVSIPTEEAVFT